QGRGRVARRIRGGRGRSRTAGRHHLRERRDRGGAAVRDAPARQTGLRALRRELERMGRGPRNSQSDWAGRVSEDRPLRPSTRLVEGGRRKEWTGAVVNPPVWRGSTHLYADSADLARGRPNEDGHFYYGRRGSPTQWALAEALTQIEPGAHGTVLYPSGTAAIAGALLGVLTSGDTLLMTDNAYEPSRAMARNLLDPLGIETRFFDPLYLEGFPT